MTERENILIDALISAGHISEQARTAIEKLKAENAALRERLEKIDSYIKVFIEAADTRLKKLKENDND